MRNIEIATAKVVGKRLTAARERLKIPAEKLAEAIGTTGTTIRRWEIAEKDYQGGCVDVSKAGALLGLEPNQLFLRDPGAGEQADWSEEEISALSGLLVELTELRRLCKGEKESPIKLISDRAAALIRAFTIENAIPQGTTIEAGKHPGTKAYIPPAAEVAQKIRDRAGEPTAQYGKKKTKS